MSADTDMQHVNMAIFDGLSTFVPMSADVNVELDEGLYGLAIAHPESRTSTWYGNTHNLSFNISDDNSVDFMSQTGDNFIAASTMHADTPIINSSLVGIKLSSLSSDLVVDGTAVADFLEGGNSISRSFAEPILEEIVQSDVGQDCLRPIVPVDNDEAEMLPSQSRPAPNFLYDLSEDVCERLRSSDPKSQPRHVRSGEGANTT